MNVPDNLDDLLGEDDAKECLQEVMEMDASEVMIIWTRPDSEYIEYSCNGMLESRAVWLLEKVKKAILDDES